MSGFFKEQFALSRCIGRGEFDGAIEVLAEGLDESDNDDDQLALIAQCHLWAKRDDEAVLFAIKALDINPKSFLPHSLLGRIYAERGEHQNAQRHLRLGLANYPEPVPTPPDITFRGLRMLGSFSPRLRNMSKIWEEGLKDPNQPNTEWRDWAVEYLQWFENNQ